MTEIFRHAPALCLLAALIAALPGCARNPVTGQQDFVVMSEEEEIALGRKEHANILKRYGRYDDESLQAYVQEVGEGLAANSHRDDLIYRFTVLDSPDVNAFALPGGYVYVTRGLMAYLNSEAELAAVLGHEIGHVTARHSVRQASAATATNLGYTIGAIFVPELRTGAAQDLFNVMGTALLRGYGRDHELEADRLGAEYLARGGYEPDAMIDVIRVLKDQELFERQLAREEDREPRVYHGVFSTHPDNDQRLKEVVSAAERLQVAEQRAPAREPYIRRLEGLVFGAAASDGVLRDNRFYHGPLDFSVRMPDGWKVENRPDRLLATAPGKAAVLQMTVEDLNRRITPQRYLEKRFGDDALRDEVPLGEGDVAGHAAVVELKTPFGIRPARVAVLFHDNRAFQIVAAAKAKDGRERFDERFMEAIRSFHRLRPEESALAEPLRLSVFEAGKGASYAALAERSRIPHHPEAQLRLLNQDYPRGEPAPGRLVKVVE